MEKKELSVGNQAKKKSKRVRYWKQSSPIQTISHQMTKMANAQQQLQAALTEFKNAQRGELS